MAIMTALDRAQAQRLKDRERAFREDIAAQLRAACEGLGLNISVETGAGRVVLEFGHEEIRLATKLGTRCLRSSP